MQGMRARMGVRATNHRRSETVLSRVRQGRGEEAYFANLVHLERHEVGEQGRVLMTWPIVCNDDPGIRPAGKQDRCFYCHNTIGNDHSRDCVMVKKKVLMRISSADGTVTGSWEFYAPHSSDPSMIEFMKNESSWCAGNVLDLKEIVWDQSDALPRLKSMALEGRCLCDNLFFKFVRVVDDRPRVENQ
jgi:hypothetical protein